MRKSEDRADGGDEAAGGARARRPGRPPRGADGAPPTRERILTEATALFARGGPQGVSMRDVAARVGIDVSSVHHHFATKTALYDACFARVYEREQRALAPLVARLAAAVATGDRGEVAAAMHHLADGFVDFLQEHPHTTFLWLRRWLEPTRDSALDAAYALPIYERVERVLLGAAAGGTLLEPTPHVTVRSLVRAAHGHITALAAAERDPVAAARERYEFRAYAHRFLDRMYPAPGAEGTGGR